MESQRQPGRTRRAFLAAGAAGVCCALAARGRPAKERWPLLDVGTPGSFKQDGIFTTFARDEVLLIRHQGAIIAVSTVCPHMGNTVARDPKDSGRMVCDGHGSEFNLGGEVTSGPAPAGLVRLGISLNERGRIVVDRNLEFPQDKWSDKRARLAIQ